MKLPAFQFYPGDWLKDPDLRRCSKSARGVWIDMICLSFECEERGVFATSNVPWPDEDIAAAVGGDTAENLRAIAELLAKRVCSRNSFGAIFCRRVVRDEHKRRACSEAGKRGGGNPALTFKGESKGHSKGMVKGESKRNSKASSSFSSSTSEEEITHTARDGPAETFLCGPSEAFERFWNAYPRRIGKQAARKAWEAVVAVLIGERGFVDSDAESWLVDRAEAFACSPAGLRPEPGRDDFRPAPAKWLSEGRYDDDPAEWMTTNAKMGKSKAQAGLLDGVNEFLEARK